MHQSFGVRVIPPGAPRGGELDDGVGRDAGTGQRVRRDDGLDLRTRRALRQDRASIRGTCVRRPGTSVGEVVVQPLAMRVEQLVHPADGRGVGEQEDEGRRSEQHLALVGPSVTSSVLGGVRCAGRRRALSPWGPLGSGAKDPAGLDTRLPDRRTTSSQPAALHPSAASRGVLRECRSCTWTTCPTPSARRPSHLTARPPPGVPSRDRARLPDGTPCGWRPESCCHRPCSPGCSSGRCSSVRSWHRSPCGRWPVKVTDPATVAVVVGGARRAAGATVLVVVAVESSVRRRERLGQVLRLR